MLYATQFTRTGEVDLTDKRGLAARKRDRSNNTKPPRTRDGAKYPGGKQMRKALAKLAARRAAYTPTCQKSGHQNTMPGSLNNA